MEQGRALLCPLAPVPAAAGHGGTGLRPARGHHQNFVKALRATRRPPPASEGGSASPEAGDGVVPHGIGAVPDGIGSRSILPARLVPTAAGHGRTGLQPVRGHRLNFDVTHRHFGPPGSFLGKICKNIVGRELVAWVADYSAWAE